MNLKSLIERAERAAGSQIALGKYIGQSEGNIRAAKSGVRGLPTYACVMIADLIGVEQISVIAASELVTETKEARRKVWQPFITTVAGVIATVILNMSPTPADAIQMQAQVVDNTVYYVKLRRLKQRLLHALKMSIPKSFLCGFVGRIDHMPT